MSELRIICFDLGINDEHLSQHTKLDFITSLLQHYARTNRKTALMAALRDERLFVSWPEPMRCQRQQPAAQPKKKVVIFISMAMCMGWSRITKASSIRISTLAANHLKKNKVP